MSRAIASLADVPNPLPASFLRGGTSKGIFISSHWLPKDRSLWDPIFLKIMGSPDPFGRQLDGIGGGISSLSKICVVGPPDQSHSGAQAQYTFAQIGIKDSVVDYSGNCGNLSSMIGVFALDQGICHPTSTRISHQGDRSLASVTSFNTNTQKLIETTFPVVSPQSPSPVLDLPQFQMAGVPGKASRIVLDFLYPSGARTGKLLPTGAPVDTLQLPGKAHILASLVDASNPTVFVHGSDVKTLTQTAALDYTSPPLLTLLEEIRQAGAIRMGLDPKAQAQPKIAVLSPAGDGSDPTDKADITVRALSMGVLHKAVPMTLGLCLGVAAGVPNTIPHKLLAASGTRTVTHGKEVSGEQIITISHPTGVVEVGAEFDSIGEVKSAKVFRTGRRIMRGEVYW